MDLINLENTTKIYRIGAVETRALDGVSLQIGAGEFTALVGPSGSGKTTLLQLIGCLDRPNSGTVCIDGQDVVRLSANKRADLRRTVIGFVFQFFALVPVLNAYENVELPLLMSGVNAKERRTRVMELLESVGMGDRVRHRPDQLSGGEQQRVAIARALAPRPYMVLADEPTANLDTANGEQAMADHAAAERADRHRLHLRHPRPPGHGLCPAHGGAAGRAGDSSERCSQDERNHAFGPVNRSCMRRSMNLRARSCCIAQWQWRSVDYCDGLAPRRVHPTAATHAHPRGHSPAARGQCCQPGTGEGRRPGDARQAGSTGLSCRRAGAPAWSWPWAINVPTGAAAGDAGAMRLPGAAVVQARGALFRAQANLAELQAGPRPQTVAAPRRSWTRPRPGWPSSPKARGQRQSSAARAELAAAQAALQQLSAGPQEEERIAALARLANAKAALRQAQSAYDQVASRNDVGMLPESRQLAGGHQQLRGRPGALRCPLCRADRRPARPQRGRVCSGPRRRWRCFRRRPRPARSPRPRPRCVRPRPILDLLTAGAGEATLAGTAVAVTEAEAVLQRAEADLANLHCGRPSPARWPPWTLSRVRWCRPGQVVATLADLSQLQVETTDLSERDVARVAEGQPAAVFVEALGVTLPGHVTRIAPPGQRHGRRCGLCGDGAAGRDAAWAPVGDEHGCGD